MWSLATDREFRAHNPLVQFLLHVLTSPVVSIPGSPPSHAMSISALHRSSSLSRISSCSLHCADAGRDVGTRVNLPS
eukprot:609099-Rhodomonas_salina.1